MLYVAEIPCIEKSAKSWFWNLEFLVYVCLRFFEMPRQKNVKSRVFLDFQKRKKRILELW